MKLNYIFSKNPLTGSRYKILSTRKSSDEERIVEYKFIKGHTEKLTTLQENDVLISEKDFENGSIENLLVVKNAEDDRLKLVGMNQNIFQIREFEDGESLIILARVDKIKENAEIEK